jgi:alpha-ketoglutarate-dependent 2,4-dichlorophenoxyacetate dioxygenase
MALSIRKLHPTFGGEVVDQIVLKDVTDAARLEEIRDAIDHYAVLVFHDQDLTNDEQAAFAEQLDGALHTKTGTAALRANRFGNEAISDISNVDGEGQLLDANDRKRLFGLANRLWHTDASFQDPPGRYSMLSARVVPPVASDTEFADMRAAYDALDEDQKARLDGLTVHHSIAYSRQRLGFELTEKEAEILEGAYHPLVRTLPRDGRRSLYLASHASTIVGWPVPEARMLLRELMEHATEDRFVFAHSWRALDLVIWDNRTTMHRATSFDDRTYVRDMRRVTTLDIAGAGAAAGS